MKFLPLLWPGIWRKAVRTALILLQVSVAFALFGVLQGMKTGVERAVANARADVLFVLPAAVGGAALPLAYLSRLRSMPGVKSVTFADGMVGTYQKPTQSLFLLALEPSDTWLTLVPKVFKVSAKDLQTLRKTRTGALISADIAKKYGWHIGERIPLNSNTLQTNNSETWMFDGDLNFAIRSIISAVLVALTFSIATMMMQTIRERTSELAVMKTLGFGSRSVFVLLAAESVVVCVAASFIGLALAWIAFPLAAKYVPGLSMPAVVIGLAVGGAVLVALISVSVPGYRAARLSVIDALAGR